MNDILEQLTVILEQRRQADAEDSYVASLHRKGLNKILEKVGEEAIETVLAAKDCGADASPQHRQALIGETADLWFHSLVMLSHLDLSAAQVLEELEKRFNISGLVEKASRTGQ
ncbi:MAG: phosphoribosyl-ATP diphosphatase [Gammaproteobacteria bacterium]|nr:phosphoribosyl-ATP diphosphatase [Pseudomonadales bacterium]MCP5347297.1 phosphoribosyl-ATP diphosphatase [Pseudomonadales bacterium]